MNTIFEKLSDAKFQSLKKCEISNLAAIVGGAASPTDPRAGSGCSSDYSYDTTTAIKNGTQTDSDSCWTTTCAGDMATAKPVGAPCI